MPNLVQISLKSVVALQNGEFSDKEGNNILSFNFIYPKAGVVAYESTKKIPLEKEVKVSFDDKPLSEKLIFKNYLQGDVPLKIILTSKQDDKKIAKIVNEAIKTGILTGIGLITGGIATTILTAVAKNFIDSIFEKDKDNDKSLIIGMIEFPIHAINTGEYTFNLSTIEEISLKEMVYQDDKTIIKTRKIPKGIGIAQVILDFKVYNEDLEEAILV